MKQSRILVISVMVIDLILMVVCIVAYFGEDRVRPEFRFLVDEYIYSYEDGEEKLLENIRARDDRDGDITDRIVIEKITENREGHTVVVYYAVSDSAGNVAKISRVFLADFEERESSMEEGAEVYGEAPERKTESLKAAAGMKTVSDGESGEDSQGQASGEPEMSGEEKDSGTGEEAGEENPDGADREANETEAEREQESSDENGREEAKEQETDRPEQQTLSGQEDRSGYPVLTLRETEVTITAGNSPPWTEIIEILRDDKDDYATLYYNLSVSRFNRNEPGDYPVTLYTEDSDGNRSDSVTLLVHVV